MSHLGDYAPGVTIYSYFTTIDADGAPTTLSGSPAATCYKDGGNTEDTSGITLTADEDGVTGLNVVAIDTSQDATFFAAGSTFVIVLTAGTVDGTSVVGYTVDTFTLNRAATLTQTLNANVVQVNDIDVGGSGTAGDPWGPA